MEETPALETRTIDELNEQAWALCPGDPAAAAAIAESARDLSLQSGPYLHGLGWSRLTLGVCAWLHGDYGAAKEDLAGALEIFIQTGDRASEAYARNNLGILHKDLGEFEQAVEHYRASLEIHRERGTRGGEANALSNIGIVHSAIGEYPQALEHLRAGLEIHRQIDNRGGQAGILNNIGLVHYSLGEYAEALEHYQSALSIHQDSGNRNGEANSLNSIGLVHFTLEEYRQALEHYQASLDIHRETGNRNGEATALGNIGMVHQKSGQQKRALQHYQAALEIFRNAGARAGEAQSLISIAATHRELGDTAASLAGLAAALDVARQTGSRSLQCDALIGLGTTRFVTGDHVASLADFTDALDLAIELGEKGTELEVRQLISRQCETLGRHEQALAHLRRHLELQKEVFSEQTRRTVMNLRASWQIEVSRKEAEIQRLRNVELKQAFDRLEQTHHELKGAQQQLVQSEKMASLGQLTAGIAHEINNPINFVSASVGPLRRDLGQIRQAFHTLGSNLPSDEFALFQQEHELDEIFDELDQLATTIENGARRTVSIVASLRSFSRLDESGLKTVDLHEGLDAALAILSGSLGERIEVQREYGSLPEVECNAGEINQVFMNVLTNAIKAIEAQGVVSIRTKSVGSAVAVTISDSGSGMTPEVVSRIFEPFFTTRDVGEGSGLGLSIAWGIIEMHRGSIAVSSRVGEGSVFTVMLPVVAGG